MSQSTVIKRVDYSEQLKYTLNHIEYLQGYFTNDPTCLHLIPQINYVVQDSIVIDLLNHDNSYIICSRSDFCNKQLKDYLGPACIAMQLTFNKKPNVVNLLTGSPIEQLLCYNEYDKVDSIESIPPLSAHPTLYEQHPKQNFADYIDSLFCFYSNTNIELPSMVNSTQNHEEL